MIKNLLYSLFLHLVLIAVVYSNFNLTKKNEEEEVIEISISMSLEATQEAKPIKPTKKKEEKIAKKKNPKIEKKPKKKIPPKKKPKKLNKKPKKKASAIKKKIKKSSKKTFKTPEKATKKEVRDSVKKPQKEEFIKKVQDKPQNVEEKIDPKNNPPKPPEPTISKAIDNLDLSAREKFNIRTQLRRCYKKATEESKLTNEIKLTIAVSIDENGYITLNNNPTNEENEIMSKDHKTAFTIAKRAIEICNPLRNLPLDKYEIWKDVVLQFGEKN